METPTEARFEARGLDSDDDRSWFRVGRDAGYIAGVGFLVTTVLYLLDAANILGLEATFRRTSAGATQDEANFWAAQFAHMHRILWDVIARDTIGPLAWVALIVLGLAIRRIAGANRPGTQLMALFLLVGGVLQITNSLLYLGDVEFWRITGWSGHPNPVAMVAVGRASVAIGNLTLWPEAFGYLVLAAGLVCLGRLCRSSDELP